MRHLHHRLAGLLFPRYSLWLDQLNHNARLQSWLSSYSLKSFSTKKTFYEFINTQISGPIDYLEFGVYRGESISAWSQINAHAHSRFYGFDSFEGLPTAWNRMEKGAFNVHGQVPNIPDHRVKFVKGRFQNTLPGFLQTYSAKNPLVIHCDADLYSSALYCLTKLDVAIKPGTWILFDELYSALHEFRALMDYTESYCRKLTPIACVDDPGGRVGLIVEQPSAPQ